MLQMINMARNPSQAFSQAIQSNPQLKEVMDMCKGKDPKDVFFAECQKRGIDPDQILNQLR